MTRPLDALGWSKQRSGGDGPPLILSYARPLQALADMTEIARHEPWLSREPAPQGLLYLCDAMQAPPGRPAWAGPDPRYIERSREAAKQLSLAWIRESIAHLLPGLCDDAGQVRWEFLSSPVPASGEARFEA